MEKLRGFDVDRSPLEKGVRVRAEERKERGMDMLMLTGAVGRA
jgi:hypothetical protein